jgi:hypothetical protein
MWYRGFVMQGIRIGVVRGRKYLSTDGFHIYGDGGTGQMDWAHPVTPRRILFWDDAPVIVGHLFGGHVVSQHLDGVRADGHLEGTHLLDENLFPATAVACEVGPFVFGRFGHAVAVEDQVGNTAKTGLTIYETVINSEPESSDDFQLLSYDSQLDRMTFLFQPSERLTG